MIVNEQLGKVYDEKFPVLIQHLEEAGLKEKVQPPFLLGLERFENEKKTGNEEWYTKADLKVMFMGKETNVWGWPQLDEGEKLIADDLVEAYEQFYGENYRDSFFLTDSKDKLKKTPFFTTGMNGLMAGIVERLGQVYPGKRAAFLWNEVSKLSSVNGTAADTTAHEYEKKYFHVIPDEIRILKPDVIIFLTGFDPKYDKYIKENFNEEDGFPILGTEALPGIDIKDAEKLNIRGIPLTYRTHHPQATQGNGKTIDGAERWRHYNAILDDIKAHLGEIIK